jgi:twitching motility protein PilT
MADQFVLDDALKYLASHGGSDLHLAVGTVPTVRIDGDLLPLPGDFERFVPDTIEKVLFPILTEDQRERIERDLELDLAYSAPGVGRFRVNYYWQRNSLGAAFRYIDSRIRSLEELGLPPQVRDFAFLPRGLVLVTGPTGSGKSTTLASLIDVVNEQRACHIITIEDPIEFLHKHKKSVVNQREVGTDTHTFADALKHVLRQDPDVILIGELRDLESMAVALTAAETGHLVFATLHTVDAAKSIDRLVDAFPSAQQGQVRTQLASALQGVVSQTLLKRKGGGRVVATEVMRVTPAVGHLIREGKTHQIYSQLQAGAEHHMHTMDQSLAKLVHRGVVEFNDAREKASDLQSFESLATRLSEDLSGAGEAMASAGLQFDDEFGDVGLSTRQRF